MVNPVLSEFYRQFLPLGTTVTSVPIKDPDFQIVRVTPHPLSRAPSVRSAAALAAAAAGNGVELRVGAIVPRRLAEPAGVIENGTARDFLKSGLANLVDTGLPDDAFELTVTGYTFLQNRLNQQTMARYFNSV